MRYPAALATILVLTSLPVEAQQSPGGGAQPRATPSSSRVEPAELKVLEIEQDADETLLREALLMLGRRGLKPANERAKSDETRGQEQADTKNLTSFIAERKQAIIDRAAELKKKRSESIIPTPSMARISFPGLQEGPAKSKEIERARIQVQLLQTQVNYSQQALAVAINELARAELTAGDEESRPDKLKAAREHFEKAQATHIEYRTKLRDEFARLNDLDPEAAMGLGGPGAMGRMGGFR